MTKLVAIIALAAAGSCNSNNPGPSPVPTIPTVVVTPSHPDAGSECSAACGAQRAKGCPNGGALSTLDHCESQCTAALRNTGGPGSDCLALIYTCGEKCAP